MGVFLFFSEQIEIIEYVVQRAVFNAFRNIFRADSGKFPSMPHDPFFSAPPVTNSYTSV